MAEREHEQQGMLARAKSRFEFVSLKSLWKAPSVGLALIRAWVYLMFLGSATSIMTWEGLPVPGYVYLVSTLSLFFVLFGSAIASHSFSALAQSSAIHVGAPFMTALGTTLIASSYLADPSFIMLGIAGGIATGLGSGLIDLGYGEFFRNEPPQRTRFEVPFAFFLAALVYTLTTALPSVIACLLCAAFPLASGLTLFSKLKIWSRRTVRAVEPVKIDVRLFSWKIGACACLTGLADGVVRAVFLTANEQAAQNLFNVSLLTSGGLSLLIVYGCALFSRRNDLRSVYKLVVFALALFFMLLPVFASHYHIESTIALTGYGTFNMFIWILLAEISYTYRLSSITIFGIGWGMVTFGVLLGSTVGQAICSFAPFAPQVLSLIAFISTLVILFSYLFVFSEDDLIRLTEIDDDSADAASGAESTFAGGDRGQPNGRPRFVDRCAEVTSEYGLTPKETEIMVLFAKGRSSARIQEDLVLSRGTVTTHLRHIYQKMGVHNKQDFLDLIEEQSRTKGTTRHVNFRKCVVRPRVQSDVQGVGDGLHTGPGSMCARRHSRRPRRTRRQKRRRRWRARNAIRPGQGQVPRPGHMAASILVVEEH